MLPKGRNTIQNLKIKYDSEEEIVYENEIYLVWYVKAYRQLTIARKDNQPVESWYDMWNIKNQVLGENSNAIEIYPSRENLIDGQNQRHLFLLDYYGKIDFENAYQIVNGIVDVQSN